ncbi:MAG: hypothetical protein GY928_23940 [Colwellia sp.]|nr:hypothetical protein [Colwellia sp.]
MTTFIDSSILSEENGKINLLAGHCQICGRLYFPSQENCSVCEIQLQEYKLPRQGSIWSWTTQNFQPKSPPYDDKQGIDNFQPFFLGIIDLGNEIRITAKLVDVHMSNIQIGMPVELVELPFESIKNGNQSTSFAFQPIKN